jgi:hypothetical protein
MIIAVEVWDFESHKYTKVENISEFFSAICGKSDAGKSSIFRAIRLAAYNEFDQASVRIGCKNCIVKITTDRGSVKVTRGVENLWEVTPLGEKTQTYNRPGRGVVKHAADIIGLKLVNLGGFDIPVNIMDQSEGHFMIEQMGDKDSSGSMRAQIIDEISGLSGIEGLIKSVSLDNNRLVREFNQIEEDIKDAENSLPDAWKLKEDSDRISAAGVAVFGYKALSKERDQCLELKWQMDNSSAKLLAISTESSSIPDLADIVRIGRLAAPAVAMVSRMIELQDSSKSSLKSFSRISSEISSIPSIDGLREKEDALASIMVSMSDMERLKVQYSSSSDSLDVACSSTLLLPDISEMPALISAADIACRKAGLMSELQSEFDSVSGSLKESVALEAKAASAISGLRFPDSSVIQSSIDMESCFTEWKLKSLMVKSLEADIINTEKDMASAAESIQDIMKTITVCPLSGAPVSDFCINQGVKKNV